MKLYGYKDNLMGFGLTFIGNNDEVAIRKFYDDAEAIPMIKMHKENFELYALGEIDENSGIIKPEVKYIARATQAVNNNNEN